MRPQTVRRRRVAALLAAAASAFVIVEARQTQQAPPPQRQQPPVFRGEVDVIRLDVSVLDRDRRPVRGLTQADFTVYEDGKPQRIVAVAEVDAAERDPTPTAWMRHVQPDIATNDLADQAGDGRLYAIVMDDVNIPWDDLDMIQAAREVGRYIIDGLGPSDVAAVIYPRDSGLTVDFTTDRSKLLNAIDKFDPREPDLWIPPRPSGPSGGGGDIPYRFSPALMRSQCERAQPTVPTLDIVASRLATVPNRRKTMILVSVGLPLSLVESRGCPGELAHVMREVFRKAQQANINIYSVDPGGNRGYERYLMNPIRRGGRPSNGTVPQAAAERSARGRREFLQIVADYTGAHAVVGSENLESGIDRIFTEDGSYYLVGYQTSNSRADGKFRRTVVKVNRPEVTIRTRTGYFAPQAGSFTTREEKEAPTPTDLSLSGMSYPTGLPLRATATALGPAAAGSRDVDVGIALSVRLPALQSALNETLTVVRNVYHPEGRTGQPTQEKFEVALAPAAGDETRYEVFQRLTLAPGRYEIRLNGSSSALSRSGTVFVDLEIPDFTRAPLVMSGISIGAAPTEGSPRRDPLSAVVPIVPTSARDFSSADTVAAFVRVGQGGDAAPQPVTLRLLVLDMHDRTIADTTETLAAAAFADRLAGHQFALPLAEMRHGPHLLSITATLPNGTSQRRDLVFRVR